MEVGLAQEDAAMGVLPDWQIQRLIKIEPFADDTPRPGSVSYGLSSYGYDVRVGRHFKIFTNPHCAVVDPKHFDPSSFIDVEADHCLIPPNSFALAETVEYFEIPRDIIAICLGKSTYARCGIIVNVTPLEPEWRGEGGGGKNNTTTPPPPKFTARADAPHPPPPAPCGVPASQPPQTGHTQDPKGAPHPPVRRRPPSPRQRDQGGVGLAPLPRHTWPLRSVVPPRPLPGRRTGPTGGAVCSWPFRPCIAFLLRI